MRKRCVGGLIVAVVLARASALSGQDSTRQESTRHDSSSIWRRWLNFDHFGVALGPSVYVRRPGWASSDQVSPGIAGGFFRGSDAGRRRRTGLIPAFKFDIFPKRLSAVDTVGGITNELGVIKTRSLLAGVGWSQPLGPAASLVITGLAGQTFNSLGATTGKNRKPPLMVSSSPTFITNSAAWEVSGRVWNQLRPNIVLLTGISYYRTRPRLTFSDGTRRVSNLDNIRADVGIAFTLFRR